MKALIIDKPTSAEEVRLTECAGEIADASDTNFIAGQKVIAMFSLLSDADEIILDDGKLSGKISATKALATAKS